MAKGLRLSGDNELAALKQSLRSRMREDEARHRTQFAPSEPRSVAGHSVDPTSGSATSGRAKDCVSRQARTQEIADVAQEVEQRRQTKVGGSIPPIGPAGVAPGPLTINGAKADTKGGPGRSPGARALDAASSSTKYRNKRTNGYASRREAKRAAELRTLEAVGDIRNLREQVPFLLIPKQDGERACSFIADFVYDERIQAAWPDEGWARVVEDCKGYRTEVYRIKRKLMLMVHGIRVRET